MRSWLPALLLLTACGSEPQAGQGPGPDASQPQPKLELLVSHQSVDFGEVELGRRGQRSLTLQNAGSVTVEVQPIVVPAQRAFEVPTEVILLPPGGQRELQLSFAPVIEASYGARVRWTQPGQPALGPETLLVGVGAPQEMPSDLSIGKVPPGVEVRVVRRLHIPDSVEPWSMQLGLQNGDGCPFVGDQAGFCLENEGAAIQAAPGGYFDVAIRFRAPTRVGRVRDTLKFLNCELCPFTTIPLQAEVSEQPLRCVARPVATASVGECVDGFIDCGNDGLSTIEVVGARSNRANFSLGADPAGPVPPGESRSIPTRHCREGRGVETATVAVTTDPPGAGPIPVLVRAPKLRPWLMIEPSELDFGWGVIGDPRKRWTSLIRTANAPVEIQEMKIEGPGAAIWRLETFGLTHVTEAEHRVELTMTATVAGFQWAELVVRSDAEQGEWRIGLSGNTISPPCQVTPWGLAIDKNTWRFDLGYVPQGRSTRAYPIQVDGRGPCEVELLSAWASPGLTPPPLGPRSWPHSSLSELPLELDVEGPIGSTFTATLALTFDSPYFRALNLQLRATVGSAQLEAVPTVFRTCSGLNQLEVRPAPGAAIQWVDFISMDGLYERFLSPAQGPRPWSFANGPLPVDYEPLRSLAGPQQLWMNVVTGDDGATLVVPGQSGLRPVTEHFDVDPPVDQRLLVVIVLEGSPSGDGQRMVDAVTQLFQELWTRGQVSLVLTTTDPEQHGHPVALPPFGEVIISEYPMENVVDAVARLISGLKERPQSDLHEAGFESVMAIAQRFQGERGLFDRPGYDLAIIVVAEEDDGGSLPAEHVATALSSVSPRGDAAPVSLYAVPWFSCGGAQFPRYEALVAQTGGQVRSACAFGFRPLFPARPPDQTTLELSQVPNGWVWVNRNGHWDIFQAGAVDPYRSTIELPGALPARITAHYLAGCAPPP